MGGGGGYVPTPSIGTNEVPRISREVEREADEKQYDLEVNAYLSELLANLNRRDSDLVGDRIERLRRALENDVQEKIDTRFGGSVRKHTYVDGLSDVDCVFMLQRTELAEKNPRQVLEYLAARIRECLPGSRVKVGNMAVTVEYSDALTLQVLPGLKTATGVRIPRSTANRWSNVVRPDGFARKLSQVNQDRGGNVVRVIKLFKSLLSGLPESEQLRGYHVESMAIEAFKDYNGKLGLKDMLAHCVRAAETLVKEPIRDSTGQSRNVDEYLGDPGSAERQTRARALKTIGAELARADKDLDGDVWKNRVG